MTIRVETSKITRPIKRENAKTCRTGEKKTSEYAKTCKIKLPIFNRGTLKRISVSSSVKHNSARTICKRTNSRAPTIKIRIPRRTGDNGNSDLGSGRVIARNRGYRRFTRDVMMTTTDFPSVRLVTRRLRASSCTRVRRHSIGNVLGRRVRRLNKHDEKKKYKQNPVGFDWHKIRDDYCGRTAVPCQRLSPTVSRGIGGAHCATCQNRSGTDVIVGDVTYSCVPRVRNARRIRPEK